MTAIPFHTVVLSDETATRDHNGSTPTRSYHSPGIVRVRRAEEDHYARLLVRIAVRQRQTEGLETELLALREVLSEFATAVLDRVDTLIAEVREARVLVTDLEARFADGDDEFDPEIAAVLAEMAAKLAGLPLPEKPHDETDPEDSADAGSKDGVPVGGPAGGGGSGDNGEVIEPQERRYSPAREAAKIEAKALYRDLARRFHPDLARTDDERGHRDEIMQRVNAAYSELDLVTLRRMARKVDPTTVAERSLDDKIAWAVIEITRIDRVIGGQQAELFRLQDTRAYRLWLQQQAGEAVFSRVERDLSRERFRLARRLRALRREMMKLAPSPEPEPEPVAPVRRTTRTRRSGLG